MDPDMDAKMEQLGRELTNFRFAEVSDSNSRSDLHILIIPSSIWRSDLRFAYSSTCVDSISAGFIRVFPESKLRTVRDEISKQLDFKQIPKNFMFLRIIGDCLTLVSKKQEEILKVKIFLPPVSSAPVLYILDANACLPDDATPLPPIIKNSTKSRSRSKPSTTFPSPLPSPIYPSYHQDFHEYLQSISLKDPPSAEKSGEKREKRKKSPSLPTSINASIMHKEKGARRTRADTIAHTMPILEEDCQAEWEKEERRSKKSKKGAQSISSHEESRNRAKPYQIPKRSHTQKTSEWSQTDKETSQRAGKKWRHSVSFGSPTDRLVSNPRPASMSLPPKILRKQIGPEERLHLLSIYDNHLEGSGGPVAGFGSGAPFLVPQDNRGRFGSDTRLGLLQLQNHHQVKFESANEATNLLNDTAKGNSEELDPAESRPNADAGQADGSSDVPLEGQTNTMASKGDGSVALSTIPMLSIPPGSTQRSKSDESIGANSTNNTKEEQKRFSLGAVPRTVLVTDSVLKQLPRENTSEQGTQTVRTSEAEKEGVAVRRKSSPTHPPESIMEQRRQSTQLWVSEQQKLSSSEEEGKKKAPEGKKVAGNSSVHGGKKTRKGTKEEVPAKRRRSVEPAQTIPQLPVVGMGEQEVGTGQAGAGSAAKTRLRPRSRSSERSVTIVEAEPSAAEVNAYLSTLRKLKEDCKKLTNMKNLLAANLRATQHSIQIQRDNVDKQWKRLYFQERKKGIHIEDLVRKAEVNAEKAHHLARTSLRGSISLKGGPGTEKLKPSEKANIILLCQRHHMTINESKLKLEDMKSRCASEKRVLGSVMLEIKSLRTNLLQRKISLTKKTGRSFAKI